MMEGELALGERGVSRVDLFGIISKEALMRRVLYSAGTRFGGSDLPLSSISVLLILLKSIELRLLAVYSSKEFESSPHITTRL